MIHGLDYLGGAKYKDLILHEHPAGWAAGFFAETFGDVYPTVDALLATGRCPLVRIHLLWSDSHSFGDKDIPKIKALAAKYNKLARKYPGVRFELSPFCEHNLKNPDKYLATVYEAADFCFPINTPWQGAISNKYKNEIHGSKKNSPGKPYNFSYDGQNAVDADAQKHKEKYSDADVFFWWTPRFNGKWNMADKTPREKRKGWPDATEIDSVIYLNRHKGFPSLPKKYLWKSHSENKGNGDLRAEKPVLIAPVKTRAIYLKADNGQTIDTLRYYGTFSDGRFRYYSSQWGYQIAEKAKRIQGNSVCNVVVNGKIIGKVNPAFRENEWRD
jgi:hypothetical protein